MKNKYRQAIFSFSDPKIKPGYTYTKASIPGRTSCYFTLLQSIWTKKKKEKSTELDIFGLFSHPNFYKARGSNNNNNIIYSINNIISLTLGTSDFSSAPSNKDLL